MDGNVETIYKRSGEKRTMDFDCQKCLQNCKSQIVDEMSPNEVLEIPEIKEIIGSDNDLKTVKEKNKLIFQWVQSGGSESYCKFKSILEETRHIKLLEVLTLEEMGVTEDKSDLWPRISSHSLKLCKSNIRRDLRPEETLDGFEKHELTDGINIRDAREQITSTQKSNMIYSEVDKQGTVGYKTLKIILEETNQTGVLESLQKAERDVTNQLVSTRDIFKDFFYYSMPKSKIRSNIIAYMLESNANIELFMVVRKLATEFEKEFDRSFQTGLIDDLNPHSITLVQDILKVLFKDEVNWGRISGAISFAGAMGVIFWKNGISEDEILNETSKYLETYIGQWIIDKGGWAAIIDFSKKNREDGNDELATSLPVDNSGDTVERPRKVQKTHNKPVPVENDNGSSSENYFAQYLLSVAGAFILGVAVSRR